MLDEQLTDLISDFLLDKKIYCVPKTVDNYRDHLIKFAKFCPAADELELFDLPELIKSYILALRKAGVRNVTIRCYMRSVKVFCSWLYETDRSDVNYFAKIKLPRSDAELKQPLTADEVTCIDDCLESPRDRLIVHLMLDAGLRAGEVCELKRSDVDLDNNVLYIRNSKFNKSRIVPLSPVLRGFILSGCFLRGKLGEQHDFLLLSSKGDPLNVNIIKLLFQRIKRKTGIDRVHAHLCRHTFATSYIVGGGNMERLRIMLGHADYNVTQTYLHLAAQYEVVAYPIYQLDPIFFRCGYQQQSNIYSMTP